jgi:Type IV pilin-like G and H, putative
MAFRNFLRIKFCIKTKMAIAMGLVAATIVMPTQITTPTVRAGENPFLESSKLPLSLRLGDLDNSWRKFRTSGQYEFGDLMQTWSSVFGLSTFNNVYYTQGETLEMAGKTYLIAYRLPVKEADATLNDMFTAWSRSCDETMPEAPLSVDSSLSLALLNPTTIGSLNDIQSVDVEAEIRRSQEMSALKMAACQEQVAEDSSYDAESNMGAINRAQQALYLETEAFTGNLEELAIGVEPETDFYRYSLTVRSPKFVTSQALSQVEGGSDYVGGVVAIQDVDGYPITITILCKSEAIAGQLPEPPTFHDIAETLTCPPGSEELYY